MDFKPKHTLSDSGKFQKDREKLGGFILEGMKTTDGTDIDWLIEHNGSFIILENKSFQNDKISIKVGQMIALERLHEKLNYAGKCYLFIFGFDEIDFKNPDSVIWYFEMQEWKNNKIPFEKDTKYKAYKIQRKDMRPIKIKDYRDLMEKYWKEFEEKETR